MARKLTLSAIFILFFLLISINTSSAGSIKVIRSWSEYDYGYALINYVNDTMFTYKGGVTVRCVALDPENNRIFIARPFHSRVDTYSMDTISFLYSLPSSLLPPGTFESFHNSPRVPFRSPFPPAVPEPRGH